MKLLIICALIAVAAANNPTRADYRQQCIDELNIQPDTIEKFKKGEYDEKTPCFTECVFNKMGVYSDGNFKVENLLRFMRSDTKTPEQLEADINGCIDNNETDSCQKSFKAFTCFKQNGLYKVPARS